MEWSRRSFRRGLVVVVDIYARATKLGLRYTFCISKTLINPSITKLAVVG
jgi:hypothetical protein